MSVPASSFLPSVSSVKGNFIVYGDPREMGRLTEKDDIPNSALCKVALHTRWKRTGYPACRGSRGATWAYRPGLTPVSSPGHMHIMRYLEAPGINNVRLLS